MFLIDCEVGVALLLYRYLKQNAFEMNVTFRNEKLFNKIIRIEIEESVEEIQKKIQAENRIYEFEECGDISISIEKHEDEEQYFILTSDKKYHNLTIEIPLKETITARQDLVATLMFIVEQFTNDRSLAVSKIKYLDQKEEYELKEQFQGEYLAINESETIISIFQDVVKKYGWKTAVVFHDFEEGYEELNFKANQIANFLITYGIKKGDLVAVIIERSNWMLELILGIWKAGCAYIPISLDYPPKRVGDMIFDAQPALVVHNYDNNTNQLEILKGRKHIKVEQLMSKLTEYDGKNLDVLVEQNSLAYILYTSGSTGRPKGVMIEHLGMVNHMKSKIHDLNMSENSVLLQNASHCFDISIWQFFSALLVGGTTAIISDECVLEPYDFLDQICMKQVSIFEVVPSYLETIIEVFENEEMEKRVLSNVENIIVTGEKLNYKLVKRWFGVFPEILMTNAYGPTEASDDITHFIMEKCPYEDFISIGHAIPNTSLYIVDENMELCPIGVKGEICVAGIGVGRGYINRPVETKNAFIRCPFTTEDVRMYRTGDYGKWMKNGDIEFIGRKDEQIKIRGYRIELSDVKNIIMNHPDVVNAEVICKEDIYGEKKLCAFIVATKKITLAEIKDVMCQYGPSYYVPNEFVFLDKFPLTNNGKVDVKALKNIEDSY